MPRSLRRPDVRQTAYVRSYKGLSFSRLKSFSGHKRKLYKIYIAKRLLGLLKEEIQSSWQQLLTALMRSLEVIVSWNSRGVSSLLARESRFIRRLNVSLRDHLPRVRRIRRRWEWRIEESGKSTVPLRGGDVEIGQRQISSISCSVCDYVGRKGREHVAAENLEENKIDK